MALHHTTYLDLNVHECTCTCPSCSWCVAWLQPVTAPIATYQGEDGSLILGDWTSGSNYETMCKGAFIIFTKFSVFLLIFWEVKPDSTVDRNRNKKTPSTMVRAREKSNDCGIRWESGEGTYSTRVLAAHRDVYVVMDKVFLALLLRLL